MKKIVIAVKAAGQSTDNAVTAITNAILDSRNVVFTNKLDDESVKQLQTKYNTYYQQEETLFKNHGIDISQMLERFHPPQYPKQQEQSHYVWNKRTK